MLCGLYLLFSFYSPKSFIFRMILFFVREETWIVARFTMEYPPRTQLRFLLFPVLEIGPWANPINDRLMIRLTMINVSINDD